MDENNIDYILGLQYEISERDKIIAELVKMLEYLRDKPVIRLLDWDDVTRIINKYKKEG